MSTNERARTGHGVRVEGHERLEEAAVLGEVGQEPEVVLARRRHPHQPEQHAAHCAQFTSN